MIYNDAATRTLSMNNRGASYVSLGPDSATAGTICAAICNLLPSPTVVSQFLVSAQVITDGLPDFFTVRLDGYDAEITHAMRGPIAGEDLQPLATAIALLLRGKP